MMMARLDRSNTASSRGGACAILNAGGALFDDCSFVGNQASTESGGAVFAGDTSHTSLINCTLRFVQSHTFANSLIPSRLSCDMDGAQSNSRDNRQRERERLHEITHTIGGFFVWGDTQGAIEPRTEAQSQWLDSLK